VTDDSEARITVKSPDLPDVEFGFGKTPIRPLFAVSDPSAETLGTLGAGPQVGLARKKLANSTAWFCSIPLRDSRLIRAILFSAGAHIYQASGDVTYAGNGMLCLHTLAGGPRTIALRSGKVINLTLSPKSTELLDSETGDRLLSEPDLTIPRGARN
jgi:hypothetical protein